jgi:hypothetical protein
MALLIELGALIRFPDSAPTHFPRNAWRGTIIPSNRVESEQEFFGLLRAYQTDRTFSVTEKLQRPVSARGPTWPGSRVFAAPAPLLSFDLA